MTKISFISANSKNRIIIITLYQMRLLVTTIGVLLNNNNYIIYIKTQN